MKQKIKLLTAMMLIGTVMKSAPLGDFIKKTQKAGSRIDSAKKAAEQKSNRQ